MSKRMERFISVLVFCIGLALIGWATDLSHFIMAVIGRLMQRDMSSHLEPLNYGTEHLGVVLVVAVVLRATLEGLYQRQFISSVNEQVKRQIEQSTADVTKDSMETFKGHISDQTKQVLKDSLAQIREQISASTKEVEKESIKPLDAAVSKLTQNLTFRIANLFNERLSKMLIASVLNPIFLRPEYTLRLRLKPYRDSSDTATTDLFEVQIELEYEVQNVTPDKAIYTLRCWIDNVIRTSEHRCRYTRVAFGHRKNSLHSQQIADLIKDGNIFYENGIVGLALETDEIAPKSSIHVEIHAIQIMRSEDHFVWNLAGLTQKLNIKVELLDGLDFKKLQVLPRGLHDVSTKEFEATAKRDELKNTLDMCIDEVLLPFQGVEIRWVWNQSNA